MQDVPDSSSTTQKHPPVVTLQDFSRRMVGSDTMTPEQLVQIREQQEVCLFLFNLLPAETSSSKYPC